MTKDRTRFDSSERRDSLIAGSSSRSRASSATNLPERQYYPSNSPSRTSHFFPHNLYGQDRPTYTSYGSRHFPLSNSSLQQCPPFGSSSQRNHRPANTSPQGRYILPNSSQPSSSVPDRSNHNYPPVAQHYHSSANTTRSIRSFPRNYVVQQSSHSQRNFYRSRNNSSLPNSSEQNRPMRNSFRNHGPFLQTQLRTPVPVAKEIKESSRVTNTEPPTAEELKEWDEIRCPVCMEHPHNAVLLICSSHDKGCRPFMCDTSYRHSYCIDQFCKGIRDKINNPLFKVTCPLCRGDVRAVKVMENARKYMNSKVRNCSKETCGFSGAYEELRKHARREHPDSRPSEVDPERQRVWRRMEEQQGFNDLLSTTHPNIDDEEVGFFANIFLELSHLGRGLSPFQEEDVLGEPDDEMTTIEQWWQDQGAWQSHFFSDDEWSESDLGLSI